MLTPMALTEFSQLPFSFVFLAKIYIHMMTQQIVDGKRVVIAMISFINLLRQDQVVHANTCILSHNFSKKNKTKQNKTNKQLTLPNEMRIKTEHIS